MKRETPLYLISLFALPGLAVTTLCFFKKLKVCGDGCVEGENCGRFPTTLAHVMYVFCGNSRESSLFRYLYTFIGEGKGSLLQYSCLANPMDRGAWQAAVHWVAKSRTRLSDFTFTFHFHALEKETCSCLENPRDSGARWAAVYGVAESDTTEAT